VGHGQPEPDAAATGVAQALEGLEEAVAVTGRDAGAVVDDLEFDPVAVAGGGDLDRPVGWGPDQRVGDDVGDGPLQQARVGMHAWQRLRHLDLDAAAVVSQAGECSRHHLIHADRPVAQAERAGLQPAHVEQVADQGIQPVGLLVDGGQQLGGRVRWERDVVLEQARDRGLDRCQGGAQVMGDGSQQRGAQLVGLGQQGRVSGGPAQPAALQRDGQLVGERLQDPPVVAGEAPAGERQGRLGIQLDRVGGVLGPDRCRVPGDRLDAPALPVPPQQGHRVQPEGHPELLHELGQGVMAVQQHAAQAGQCLGLGAGPRRLRRPPRGQVDKRADHPGDSDEDDQGQ